jgi:squalene-hopene/tetraprenyl-beta-curcumene cyclase
MRHARRPIFLVMVCLGIALFTLKRAVGEELTLANSPAPAANTADEAKAEAFSLDQAVRFLDVASLNWTAERQCFTCHTNFSYLMARPTVDANVKAHQEVRAALETMVEDRWESAGPRWDAEVIMAAAVLAMNDAATTGRLHATTKKALDRMWTTQKEDGGFRWLTCGWPPMESDDHYGVTIALVGIGAAPDDYASTPEAKKGVEGLKKYLAANPAPTLHHEAMILWAASSMDDLLTKEEKQAINQRLLEKQRPDGGWALASLGNWKRADDKEQDTTTSDGYATGFLTYVLRQNGMPKEHEAIKRSIDWLKKNQRASGRWHTRSLNRDNKHFISHAGTAFAVLALKACE